ncbi:MAG: SH3 domain-containing protein [Candidatus Aenigmarchaeota archaeon]|nr:SH3 domain-containing protein [Candidatus Aenigmarchaeota archaeon]
MRGAPLYVTLAMSALLAAACSPGQRQSQQPKPLTAEVTARDVRLRTDCGTNYDVVRVLERGEKLTITGNSPYKDGNEPWYLVKTPKGEKGCVASYGDKWVRMSIDEAPQQTASTSPKPSQVNSNIRVSEDQLERLRSRSRIISGTELEHVVPIKIGEHDAYFVAGRVKRGVSWDRGRNDRIFAYYPADISYRDTDIFFSVYGPEELSHWERIWQENMDEKPDLEAVILYKGGPKEGGKWVMKINRLTFHSGTRPILSDAMGVIKSDEIPVIRMNNGVKEIVAVNYKETSRGRIPVVDVYRPVPYSLNNLSWWLNTHSVSQRSMKNQIIASMESGNKKNLYGFQSNPQVFSAALIDALRDPTVMFSRNGRRIASSYLINSLFSSDSPIIGSINESTVSGIIKMLENVDVSTYGSVDYVFELLREFRSVASSLRSEERLAYQGEMRRATKGLSDDNIRVIYRSAQSQGIYVPSAPPTPSGLASAFVQSFAANLPVQAENVARERARELGIRSVNVSGDQMDIIVGNVGYSGHRDAGERFLRQETAVREAQRSEQIVGPSRERLNRDLETVNRGFENALKGFGFTPKSR